MFLLLSCIVESEAKYYILVRWILLPGKLRQCGTDTVFAEALFSMVLTLYFSKDTSAFLGFPETPSQNLGSFRTVFSIQGSGLSQEQSLVTI